jgi:hypothetical protein
MSKKEQMKFDLEVANKVTEQIGVTPPEELVRQVAAAGFLEVVSCAFEVLRRLTTPWIRTNRCCE